MLTGFLVTAGIAAVVYYGIGWVKPTFGDYAGLVIAALLFGAFIVLPGALCLAACRIWSWTIPNSPMVQLPEVGPTVKSGLHYLLPVVVLVWCLMIERLSPGLSAFWASRC